MAKLYGHISGPDIATSITGKRAMTASDDGIQVKLSHGLSELNITAGVVSGEMVLTICDADFPIFVGTYSDLIDRLSAKGSEVNVEEK